LFTFACVASVRRIAAVSFIDTANPPESSDDELILDPLDNRFRLFCKLAFVCAKLNAADIDAAFVLIVIIVVFLYFVYAASAPPSDSLVFRCAVSPSPGFSRKFAFIHAFSLPSQLA